MRGPDFNAQFISWGKPLWFVKFQTESLFLSGLEIYLEDAFTPR
jgi:hypothetical protein